MRTDPSPKKKLDATIALRALPQKSPAAPSSSDGHSVIHLAVYELTDADILSVLCDLFAGRAATAFGERLDWWTETLQCDLDPAAAAGVALVAISKWQFDQAAGAAGVKQLQDDLVRRARQIIARGGRP